MNKPTKVAIVFALMIATYVMFVALVVEAKPGGCDYWIRNISVVYACSTNQSLPCAYAVDAQVQNIGNVICPLTNVYMKIQNSTTYRTININITAALQPLATFHATMPYERDLNTTYGIAAIVDPNNNVAELDEKNNYAEGQVNITIHRYP